MPSWCKVPGQYDLCLSHKAGWKVCPPGVKFLVNMVCVFKSQGRMEGVPSSCKVPGQYGLCV